MIGGNIITASPISDLNPILVAVGTILYVTSKNSKLKMQLPHFKIRIFYTAPQYTRKMDKSFFVSYRKTVLKHDEVLVSLLIPWTQEVLVNSS